jgi:hypothetical protein
MSVEKEEAVSPNTSLQKDDSKFSQKMDAGQLRKLVEAQSEEIKKLREQLSKVTQQRDQLLKQLEALVPKK